jgi:hypothetical protein
MAASEKISTGIRMACNQYSLANIGTARKKMARITAMPTLSCRIGKIC